MNVIQGGQMTFKAKKRSENFTKRKVIISVGIGEALSASYFSYKVVSGRVRAWKHGIFTTRTEIGQTSE